MFVGCCKASMIVAQETLYTTYMALPLGLNTTVDDINPALP